MRKAKRAANGLQESAEAIANAPESLAQGGEQHLYRRPESYAFKPKLGAVPDFDVPAFLAELSGVADISYAQELPSIAPSNLITDDLPDLLPDVVDSKWPCWKLAMWRVFFSIRPFFAFASVKMALRI